MVLAASAVIRPLPSYNGMNADLAITALASLLVIIFIYTNKERSLRRWSGAVLLLIYTAFLVWKISTL